MIGCDISALEDSTKQHYIYFYDPEYVKEMRVPGFDPHIDIGVLAGLMTKKDEEFFKWADKQEQLSEDEQLRFKCLKKVRGTSKQVNFAAVYLAGPAKIAETAKIPLEQAVKLHTIYWQRNWAVKEIAKHVITKKVKNQTWLYNPLSGFWLFLENEKDKFSALNQNTGVYVFDMFVANVRKRLKELNIFICLQYHDETLMYFKKEFKEQVIQILNDSIKQVNDTLKLNVEINISIDEGLNYAECH